LRPLANEIPEALRSLVARCLQAEPAQRPTAKEICRTVREQLAPDRASATRSGSRPLAALMVAAAAIVASLTGAVWANDEQPERVGRIAPGLAMATTLAIATSTAPAMKPTVKYTQRSEQRAEPSDEVSPASDSPAPAPVSVAQPQGVRRPMAPRVARGAESDEQLLRQW
jgi:hypothetical protein